MQGVNPEITHWLAKDPLITAIGFTGSGLVGKLLIKLAQEREIPIPVFAEMGSLNPVFFTPGALAEKAEELAKAAMDSALLGSGQFCTKPGIIVVPKDAAGDKFISQVQAYVAEQKVGPLLNKGIATRFTEAISSISKAKGVKVLTGVTNPDGYGVTPSIFVVDDSRASRMLTIAIIKAEKPDAIVYEAANADEALALLNSCAPSLAILDMNMPGMSGLELAVLVKAGVKHDSIIQTGHVAAVISAAADKKFDLVVMGSKGRSGLVDMLVGSVAQRVLATCKKPVLLVK